MRGGRNHLREFYGKVRQKRGFWGWSVAIGISLALVAALTVQAQAATYDVDRTDDAPGATACAAASNDCSLRGAIITANANAGPDTINLPAGTYTLTEDGNFEDAAATGDLDITDDLTINGAGADTTIITAGFSAGNEDRVFDVNPGGAANIDVTINDVTVSDGDAGVIGQNGGGFQKVGEGTLTINRSVITENQAFEGGGIYNGAAFNDGSLTGTVRVVDSTISLNMAVSQGRGGGIFNADVPVGTGARLEVINSTLFRNTADSYGGGIFNGG